MASHAAESHEGIVGKGQEFIGVIQSSRMERQFKSLFHIGPTLIYKHNIVTM
jgi:hypothetical protein